MTLILFIDRPGLLGAIQKKSQIQRIQLLFNWIKLPLNVACYKINLIQLCYGFPSAGGRVYCVTNPSTIGRIKGRFGMLFRVISRGKFCWDGFATGVTAKGQVRRLSIFYKCQKGRNGTVLILLSAKTAPDGAQWASHLMESWRQTVCFLVQATAHYIFLVSREEVCTLRIPMTFNSLN